MRYLAILLALILFALTMAACTRSTSAGDRTTTLVGRADAGKPIFQQNCVVCHGMDGTKIPDWRATVQKMTDAQVRKQIENGSDGMPSFKDTLSKQQIADVAAYAEKLARS